MTHREFNKIKTSKKRIKLQSILKTDRTYTLQNNAYCFIAGDRLPKGSAGDGLLGSVQEFFKKFGRLYIYLLRLFSPVQSSLSYRKYLRDLLGQYGKDHVIVNLGSGPNCLKGREDIINVDIFAFDPVDVVSDATDLPFENDSIDLIFNIAMLEHARNPNAIINEMYRVLKAEGKIFCYVPFIVPYHAAPDDFSRWTISGCLEAFTKFNDLKIFIGAGPTSGMLWIFQEWLSILFSFGNRIVHDILLLSLMLVTAPVKVIDLIIEKFPNAKNVASGFGVVGKK